MTVTTDISQVAGSVTLFCARVCGNAMGHQMYA